MTKRDILKRLDEIGFCLVRSEEMMKSEHYTELCLAFGVAYQCVCQRTEGDVELYARLIKELGLAGGSVQ